MNASNNDDQNKQIELRLAAQRKLAIQCEDLYEFCMDIVHNRFIPDDPAKDEELLKQLPDGKLPIDPKTGKPIDISKESFRKRADAASAAFTKLRRQILSIPLETLIEARNKLAAQISKINERIEKLSTIATVIGNIADIAILADQGLAIAAAAAP